MRLVLAPEPVDWLEAVGGSRLAPWALPLRGPGEFFRRRFLTGARRQLGWTGLEAMMRLWAGSDTARGMQARFALRGLAARWATAGPEDEVVAPSLAALELFARHPGRKILLLDLPLLRELHADLDAAATANPSSQFLHRYRASRDIVVRQEQELALANEVWVRGAHAATLLERRGLPWKPLPTINDSAPTNPPRGNGILLAGLASARHGLPELLRVVEAHRDWRLHLRCGPGTEPANLLDHLRCWRPAASKASEWWSRPAGWSVIPPKWRAPTRWDCQ